MVAPHNTLEQNPDGIGRGASPVRLIQHLEDAKTFEVTLDGASSPITGIPGLIGEAIPDDVVEIEIIPLDGDIAYNPNGTAVPGTHARILSGVPYLLTGSKLNTLEIIKSSGDVQISIITRQLI